MEIQRNHGHQDMRTAKPYIIIQKMKGRGGRREREKEER